MNKRLYTILVFFTISLCVTSCKNKPSVDYTLVSGHIENKIKSDITITGENGFRKTITPDAQGNFQDTLYIEKNGIFSFWYDQFAFNPYLENGTSLVINFDNKDLLNSVEIQGEYKDINHYFYQKYVDESEFRSKRKELLSLEEPVFESKVSMMQDKLEELFNTLQNVPAMAQKNELASIKYSKLLRKNQYKSSHGYFTKNPDFKVSEAFNKELEELAFDKEEDYKYSSAYKRLVNSKVNSEANSYMQKDSLPISEATFKALNNLENEYIKNQELYKFTSIWLSMSNQKEKVYNDFLNMSTDETHKIKVKELFEALKLLDPGQPSPKFHNFENYAGGTTSLDDLKGRYVYVDVWATWCGPCKYEVPFLKELEEKYHDNKNIHFLSLSLDKQEDKEKWRKMITERELGGVQLISDNAFDTPFVQAYKIRGIPQFIMIDPEGNIVQANAPRPSEKEKIEKLFSELNI